jgi:SAM-dependent methyltransferase
MQWRRLMYNIMYRLGSPRWDTGITPPEMVTFIEGEHALPAGRALDLGCGTGSNVLYLAQHGWEGVGVDFSSAAIEQARKKAGQVPRATFVQGDVSELAHLGVDGPFDLVLDVLCLHGLPNDQRQAYAQGVARVTRSGALFMIWAITLGRQKAISGVLGLRKEEVVDRFGQDFTLERVQSVQGPRDIDWYTLRRR